jgi:hypothetical protein
MFMYILVISLIAFCEQGHTSSLSIIGKWLGKGPSGEQVIFHFKEDSSAVWFVDAAGSPGPIQAKYKIDYSATPVKIDIFEFDFQQLKGVRLLGIIEFHSNNEMLLYGEYVEGQNGSRPTKFGGDATLFTRATGAASDRVDYKLLLYDSAVSVSDGDILTLTGCVVDVDKDKFLLTIDKNNQQNIKFGNSKPMILSFAHITEVPIDVIDTLKKPQDSALNRKIFSVKAKYSEHGRRKGLVFESLKDMTP